MTRQEAFEFKDLLVKSGYTRTGYITCETERGEFHYYQAFRYKNGKLKYQLFFTFWSFPVPEQSWSVSVIVLPESCEDNVGRRDLHLSVDWSTNLEKVEKVAEGYYRFIRKADKL